MKTLTLRDLPFVGSLSGAGGGGIPTDDPDSHANLVDWWKASDLDAALADGDKVASWGNKKSAHHATQSTDNLKPILKKLAHGNSSVVRFLNQYMSFTLFNGGVAHTTIAAVSRTSSGNGAYTLRTAGPQYLARFNNYCRAYDGGLGVDSTTFGNPYTDFAMVTFRLAGTLVTWRENKTARGTNINGINGMNYEFIGGQDTGFVGDIGEICIYSRILSDAELDSLYDGYFKILYSDLP